MGFACRTRGGDQKCVQNFGRETWKKGDYVENLGIDGRILKVDLI
jgi:hypothetical protein